MSKSQKKFVVIDGNALIHRAWHALPPTLTTKSGEVVNAVYGFTMIMLKVLKDLKPDYLAVTFDLAAPTFRHKEYKEYKAQRVKQADELYAQFPRIKEVVRAFNIPIYEKEGFEADDVIATLVCNPAVEKIQSIIVTGDMDTMQLVDENTLVYTMHKGISDTVTYDIEAVKNRYGGLSPEQMVDYKGLRGDVSDNIPGVKGIGEKSAINLLVEFGTLENIYKDINSPKIPERYRKLLIEHKDEAFFSKKLATLIKDVPIDFDLEDVRLKGYDVSALMSLFQELEFKSLIAKIPKDFHKDKEAKAQGAFNFESVPQLIKDNKADYRLIKTQKDFDDFLKELKKQKIFVFDTETSGLNPFEDELLGVSFSWQDGLAYYLPAKKEWLEAIKPIMADSEIKKAGHNIKFDLSALASVGVLVAGIYFDSMVASYLINPGSRQHNLDGLAFSEFGYQMQPIEDLIGKGKNQITLKEVSIEKVSDYSCEDADFTWRLIKPLTKQLKEKNNFGLLEKIEIPLIPVLAEMEKNGIEVDVKYLKKMEKEVGGRLEKIEQKIYTIAGEKFNIASPLQLKQILFEKLKISTQGLSRTKTGISTAADQLEKLKGQHEIIDYIMEFRELAKLKSTYIEALPRLVDKNNRVHTSFNQTITATGRLSSSDPNLQNIPIRTELGAKIRCAFVAGKEKVLISADYSQIELRIIASLANDKKMIESFEKGEDIHTRTASEINNVPLEKVTKEMRYAAKAVNFGIIYGQGAWGLAASAGISRGKAIDFIDTYFEIHKDIFDYLENTKQMAHKVGFVETWFGRRRYLPEINSTIQPVKAAAERMAINHPIQGTAADLMKLAMVEVYKGLPAICSEAKMILQVHDELVLEVPKNCATKVAEFVKDKMENIYKLRAPIEAEVEAGSNWGELKQILL